MKLQLKFLVQVQVKEVAMLLKFTPCRTIIERTDSDDLEFSDEYQLPTFVWERHDDKDLPAQDQRLIDAHIEDFLNWSKLATRRIYRRVLNGEAPSLIEPVDDGSHSAGNDLLYSRGCLSHFLLMARNILRDQHMDLIGTHWVTRIHPIYVSPSGGVHVLKLRRPKASLDFLGRALFEPGSTIGMKFLGHLLGLHEVSWSPMEQRSAAWCYGPAMVPMDVSNLEEGRVPPTIEEPDGAWAVLDIDEQWVTPSLSGVELTEDPRVVSIRNLRAIAHHLESGRHGREWRRSG